MIRTWFIGSYLLNKIILLAILCAEGVLEVAAL